MTTNGDTDNRPRFSLPPIVDHPNGWGPTTLREDFKDMPYQPFSKDTKLGKVADWTGNVYHDKRHQHKYISHLNSGSQYAYFHEEDESSFQLVDTMKVQKSAYQRQRMRFNAQLRARRDRDRRMHNQNVTNMQTLNKTQLQRERDRQRQIRKWQKQYYGRQAHDYNRRGARNNRDASVQVQDTWEVLEELDFPRLGKLCLPVVSESKDIYTCGALEYYDKSYDRVSTKNERRLGKINRVIHMVTTTQDPIIQRLAKEKSGNVFCTDAILATLMACPRSNYSWDIVVQKIGDKLFFDKREDSDFDLLTVRETATDPPHEEGNHINSPENLALEATFIQHNFTQQVLKMNDDKFRFPNANPFMEDANDELASVGYRYRKWDLGNDINLVVRCEHDAVTLGPNQETQFMNIKTLMEWDSRAITNAVDWRAKLDTQRGAVLASELKNNAFKLAKWTACSLLAGSDQLKFGFVSRINPKDSSKHVILGTSQFKPHEFAHQINLNMENAWGIIRCIIDMLMKRDSGKYLIMKDPNKPMVRIYDIPNNAFESDSSEDEEDDDDDDDDDEVSNRRN